MKTNLRKTIVGLLAMSGAFALSGCNGTIYDLFRQNNSASEDLKTAAKDGSSYDAPTLAEDSSGTNYASQKSKYNYHQVSAASGDVQFPSTGNQNILVIPVEFSDYTSVCTDKTRQNIYDTFFGDSADTGWESVASFYSKSSFGQLTINGTVSGWYNCGYSTSAFAKLTSSDKNYDPTWTILEGAVSWYEKTYATNGAEFDNDNDGLLDGVWLIYSAPYYTARNGLSQDVFWAYTYADYSVTSVSSTRVGMAYSWASYNFMYEGYGTSSLDAHTYIHETGHLFGLDDYYASSTVKGTTNYAPMGCLDMMDCNIIDHDAFSKFALGWIHPFVVTGATTITLKPSATSGQAILLPTSDGWNGSAFDEYMLLEYYTPELNNKSDSESAYSNGLRGFTTKGVRIYHVDARLAKVVISSNNLAYSYTDTLVPLSDTSGTLPAHSNGNARNRMDQNDRLIQAIDCTLKRNFDTEKNILKDTPYFADNTSLFTEGTTFDYQTYRNSFPNFWYSKASTMNNGTTFGYNVSFSSLTSEGVTVTISAS
jgi:M6 family metalloprotease-like protein